MLRKYQKTVAWTGLIGIVSSMSAPFVFYGHPLVALLVLLSFIAALWLIHKDAEKYD